MSTMLKDHIDTIEQVLLAKSKVAANSGHSLHKGTPREIFIKEFLMEHISERVAIGHGEIIDIDSKANEQRNQQDIVVYKKEYPKIHFGGDIYGFLAESVVATIEVKSRLTKHEVEKSIQAAHNTKKLRRSLFDTVISAGSYEPTSILSYVVAYNGPSKIDTVRQWLTPIHSSFGIPYPIMGRTIEERMLVASPSLDGIFVLGKGFVLFDNFPITFRELTEMREIRPDYKWVFADKPDGGNLLLLFLVLTKAISTVLLSNFNPLPYMPNIGSSTIWLGE